MLYDRSVQIERTESEPETTAVSRTYYASALSDVLSAGVDGPKSDVAGSGQQNLSPPSPQQ